MTYDCSWKYRTLAALDSDLPQEQRADVQRHVASCAMCTALARELQRDLDRAKRATRSETRVRFEPATLAAVQRRTARRHARRFAAATAVVMLALSAAYVRAHDAQQRAQEATQLAAEIVTFNTQLDRIDEAIELWRSQPPAPLRPSHDTLWLERAQTEAVRLRASEIFQAEFGTATQPETHVN